MEPIEPAEHEHGRRKPRVSRDEAREIALVAIVAAIVVRVSAGVVQMLDEVSGDFTLRSMIGRFFSPLGSTVGILALGAVLLVVLSPSGSIAPSMVRLVRRTATAVAALGAAATFYTLALSYNTFLGSLRFVLINAIPVTVLAGAGWWILRHFDDAR